MIALVTVWLVAGAVLCFYMYQHGVSMKNQALELVAEADTADAKLKQASDNVVKAKALLNRAARLANEAKVPVVAELLGHSETLADEALKIVDTVRFHADDDADAVTPERDTIPSRGEN